MGVDYTGLRLSVETAVNGCLYYLLHFFKTVWEDPIDHAIIRATDIYAVASVFGSTYLIFLSHLFCICMSDFVPLMSDFSTLSTLLSLKYQSPQKTY